MVFDKVNCNDLDMICLLIDFIHNWVCILKRLRGGNVSVKPAIIRILIDIVMDKDLYECSVTGINSPIYVLARTL